MFKALLGATALAGSLILGTAAASAAIVTNGSFEEGANGLDGWTTQKLFGTTPGIGITVITTGVPNSPYPGDNVVPYDGNHAAYFVDDNASERLYQSVNLTGGTLYNFSFALYATTSGAANDYFFSLEDSASKPLSTFTNSSSSTQVPVGVWTPYSYNFSVASTGSYLLNFSFTSGLTPAKDVLLDAVTINAVPEPMSIALLGAGLAAVGFVRRRKSPAA